MIPDVKAPLMIALGLASLANANPKAQADLKKLSDPKTRLAEVARLATDGKVDRVKSYHWLEAKQRGKRPALHVLCVDYGLGRSSYTGPNDYKIEMPEELFSKADAHIFAQTKPSLREIKESVLMVFDAKGREIEPFGGNNYINRGYCYDFNADGILDRADFTNYGVEGADGHTIQGFELQSVEAQPRTLLHVIYNWHSYSAADENTWTFSCADEDADGFVEITFGPALPTQDPRFQPVVFRWDPKAQKYVCPELSEKAHVRVLKPGESLKSIAKAGGLGYPLIGKSKDDDEDGPPPASSQKPYAFESLKGKSDKELATFFKGKERHDHWRGSVDSFANRIPNDLWNLPTKQAALALAEANRTPTHQKTFQIAIDDRDDLAPPKSGWLVYDWGSSGCYSYSSRLFALRFGVPEPHLTVFGYNSIGVVGRNPWADQPAHSVRHIKLTDKEASFIADTVFWLDRIRTRSIEHNDGFAMSFSHSTADGHGSVAIHEDGKRPKYVSSGTVWAMSSVSGQWGKQYDKTVFTNLVHYFMRQVLPDRLGERWSADNEIGHHSLTTPTSERLAPRVNEDGRKRLQKTYAMLLKMHQSDPLPAHALLDLVHASGTEALTNLLPALETLAQSLKSNPAQDKEFEALKEKFERDHFGGFLQDRSARDRESEARYEELKEKREFLPAAILRKPLEVTIRRLKLVSNEAELMKVAVSKKEDASWAMTQLRRVSPKAWADIIEAQFDGAFLEQRRAILQTLCAGAPETAEALIADLSDLSHYNLIIEIARFHAENKLPSLEQDLPYLMKLVRDRDQIFHRRGAAMELLADAELSPGMSAELRELLVAEIRDPHKDDDSPFDTLDEAVRALMNLPQAERHLELILTHPELQKRSFETGFRAIHQMTEGREDRKALLSDFLRPRFKTSSGFMNSMFCMILAHDLRPLAPELAAFASEGPDAHDGDGSNYSGGSFKGPLGQRYHLAREITALWTEPDDVTRSRMWVFLAAAHADEFDDGESAEDLRKLAGAQIRKLPAKQRRETIQSALKLIPVEDYYSETREWLIQLAVN